jgi:hypothetical protein
LEEVMSLKFCIPLKNPETGTMDIICVPIIDPWRFLKPYPGWHIEPGVPSNPWFMEPQPRPWIIWDGLTDEIINDLTVLAAASVIAEGLSPQSREMFNQGVERLIGQMQLPADAYVEFQ